MVAKYAPESALHASGVLEEAGPGTVHKKPHSHHGDDEHEEHHGEEGEPWLMSFADLILNLLLFFIVLYSISQVDEKKLQELAESINGDTVPQTRIGKAESAEENGEILQEIQTLLQKLNPQTAEKDQQNKAAEVKAKLGEMFSMAPGKDKENDLFEVVLAGDRYFARGSPRLTAAGALAVKNFATQLKPLAKTVSLYIEGHASPAEVDPKQGVSEWQLASERAANALIELQKNGVTVKSVSTAGFGARVNLDSLDLGTPQLQSGEPVGDIFQRARVHLRVVKEIKD